MYRVEVYLKSHLSDARGLSLVSDIYDLGITTISDVRIVDIYWLDADLAPEELELVCRSLLADQVTQEYQYFTPSTATSEDSKGQSSFKNEHSYTIEVAYNAGVTDPVEDTVMKAVRDLSIERVRAVRTAKRYMIEGHLDEAQLEVISSRLLVNPIVQHVVKQEQLEFIENPQYKFRLNRLNILGLDITQLSEVRGKFNFTDDELQAIMAYFSKQGRNPTDAELETLAQTWSEHCVHKTFKGKFSYGGVAIDNLLKSTIVRATEELGKPWCLSVFEDNAGVIDFDGRWDLCF